MRLADYIEVLRKRGKELRPSDQRTSRWDSWEWTESAKADTIDEIVKELDHLKTLRIVIDEDTGIITIEGFKGA